MKIKYKRSPSQDGCVCVRLSDERGNAHALVVSSMAIKHGGIRVVRQGLIAARKALLEKAGSQTINLEVNP